MCPLHAVGLIVSAVSLPLRQILVVLLQMSIEPDMEFRWLSVAPLTFSFLSVLRLRRFGSSWRWRGTRGVLPLFLVRFMQRYDFQPLKFVLDYVCESLALLMIRFYGRSAAARRALHTVPPHEAEEMEEKLLHAGTARMAGGLGFALIYGCWVRFPLLAARRDYSI